MTLTHTKGYQDVLEAVKERAKKKAKAFGRSLVTVSAEEVIRRLGSLTDAQVTLAHGDAEVVQLSQDELSELHLLFAEDFLHHYRYELEQVRQERASTEEKVEMAKEGICVEPCGVCNKRQCDGSHPGSSGIHLCGECF
jgi:hypothetical protein